MIAKLDFFNTLSYQLIQILFRASLMQDLDCLVTILNESIVLAILFPALRHAFI